MESNVQETLKKVKYKRYSLEKIKDYLLTIIIGVKNIIQVLKLMLKYYSYIKAKLIMIQYV